MNGYTGEKNADKYLLQTVCNVSYSIKVLLSNALMTTVLKANKKDGFTFHTLPLRADVDVLRALDFVTVKDKLEGDRRHAEENESDGHSDTDIDSDDDNIVQKRKKKKRKRGKGG